MVREAAVMLKFSQQPCRSVEEINRTLRNAIRQIMAETAEVSEQIESYRVRCERSRADFFRKKQQIESGEFDEFDTD
jgi:uncharacterized protein YoxC